VISNMGAPTFRNAYADQVSFPEMPGARPSERRGGS
jgi:hypothetical protein